MRRFRSLILSAFLFPTHAFATSLPESIQAAIRQYPSQIRQQQAVLAAEAARGELWQRLIPGLSLNAQNVSSSSASLGNENRFDRNSLLGQATLSLSPSGFFAWKIQDANYKSVKEQSRILANQLALQTVSAYSAIVFGNQQLSFLRSGFLKTLRSVANDPKIKSSEQLSDAVINLIYSLETQIVTQEGNLAIASAQFESLTGLSATGVKITESLDRLIPVFSSREVARDLAERQSPLLKSGEYQIEAVKQTSRAVLPSYIQPTTSFSPGLSSISLQNASAVSTRSGVLSAGVNINLDVFGYARTKKVAKLNYDQANQTQALNERTLQLQIDSDYIRYQQQAKTLCSLRPQSTRILISFNRLIHDIDTGQPYNPALVLTAVPQAIATIGQLYTAETVSISAVADLHAQIGDLSQPETWIQDAESNPEEICKDSARR